MLFRSIGLSVCSQRAQLDVRLPTLRPIVALNSSGRNNRYQHPHPEVVQRLEDCRIGMFDTKQEGDIRIIVTPICNFLFTARRGFAIIG